MKTEDTSISIAIIGAGISSLCLARGLLQHKYIKVRIYEARSEIGQHDGSGVGIAANGQKGLELIDPELLQCLYRAGGVENKPTLKLLLAETGEEVLDLHSDPSQRTVLRSRLLDGLRKTLPDEIIKTGKRLTSIEERSGADKAVLLAFEDGDTVAVDAIIGADGINSTVRSHIRTDKEAEWIPGFNTRIVIPMSEGRSIFGEDYFAQPTQKGWVGNGGLCLTDSEDDGEAMQVIASMFTGKREPEVFGKAWTEVPKTFWTERLKGYGWIGEKVSQVIENRDKVYASCYKRHDETPVYTKGRLCLAGDAAGSFSPAMGAGASQAIEDALILNTVLGCLMGPQDLEKAFQVYEKIRHPRRNRVAMESNKQGLKITGNMEGVGRDKEKLAKAVQEPYEWLFNFDLGESVEEARRLIVAEQMKAIPLIRETS